MSAGAGGQDRRHHESNTAPRHNAAIDNAAIDNTVLDHECNSIRLCRLYNHISTAITDPPGTSSSMAAYGPSSRTAASPFLNNIFMATTRFWPSPCQG